VADPKDAEKVKEQAKRQAQSDENEKAYARFTAGAFDPGAELTRAVQFLEAQLTLQQQAALAAQRAPAAARGSGGQLRK
jgi:hypothetical protein